MSSTPETVCPKCGATELKNFAWVRPLGVCMCFANAVVQLVLGLVFSETLNLWSKVGDSITWVAWGIFFWFVGKTFQKWRCTKCKHSW